MFLSLFTNNRASWSQQRIIIHILETGEVLSLPHFTDRETKAQRLSSLSQITAHFSECQQMTIHFQLQYQIQPMCLPLKVVHSTFSMF